MFQIRNKTVDDAVDKIKYLLETQEFVGTTGPSLEDNLIFEIVSYTGVVYGQNDEVTSYTGIQQNTITPKTGYTNVDYPILVEDNPYFHNESVNNIFQIKLDGIDLGTPEKPFSNIWVGSLQTSNNTIYVGGVPISSDTTNNTLIFPSGSTIGGVNPGILFIKGSIKASNFSDAVVKLNALYNFPKTHSLGDSYFVSYSSGSEYTPSHFFSCSSINPVVWTDCGVIQGPRGYAGPQGSVGPQGPQGRAGSKEIGAQGPTGPTGGSVIIENDSKIFSNYNTVSYLKDDFFITRTENQINIKTNALKYLDVDSAGLISSNFDTMNFISGNSINISSNDTNNIKNLTFNIIRYNDIYELNNDLNINSGDTNIVFDIAVYNKYLLNNDDHYIFVGNDTLRLVFNIQLLYKWINSDLSYRFILNMYKIDNEGNIITFFNNYIGVYDMNNSQNTYIQKIMLSLNKNDRIYFNIIKNNNYELRIDKKSSIFTEYIL